MGTEGVLTLVRCLGYLTFHVCQEHRCSPFLIFLHAFKAFTRAHNSPARTTIPLHPFRTPQNPIRSFPSTPPTPLSPRPVNRSPPPRQPHPPPPSPPRSKHRRIPIPHISNFLTLPPPASPADTTQIPTTGNEGRRSVPQHIRHDKKPHMTPPDVDLV